LLRGQAGGAERRRGTRQSEPTIVARRRPHLGDSLHHRGHDWWGGHRVLVAPQWIEAVSWPDAKVSVDLTRQKVKDAPAYDSAAHLDRQQEQAIFEHYGHPGYWTSQAIREEA
jgi:hypothetical protein